MKQRKWHLNDYLALALICFAIIVYQLCLTKLLSTIAWYHYTFLTLSLVMLGLGAPGIWLATVRNPVRFLPYLLLLAAASLVLSELYVMHHIHHIGDPFSRVLLIILAILVPMLCLGGCVCIYLIKADGPRFGKMYAADLFGAFAGAALVIPLIHLLPVPHIIALLGALILVVLIGNVGKLRLFGYAGLAAIGGLLVAGEPLKLMHSKYDERGLGRIYEKWTPTARITVFDNIFWVQNPEIGFAWGPGAHYPQQKIEQYWIEQDASAGTPITKFDGRNLDNLDYLLHDVTSVAYILRNPQSAAIIGGGGGRDILTALKAGIKDVRVIELNQGIVDTVSREFGDFSGDIYHHPSVDVQIAEGRSYLARTRKQYDLIQISLIDSWAASMAGAFALAENNLYTKEAYQTYFRRLAPGGLITTSRWTALPLSTVMVYETERLARMIYESLRELGIGHPEKHIAITTGDKIANVITSRSPFSVTDMEKLRSIASQRGFNIVYPVAPEQAGESLYHRLLSDQGGALVDELLQEGTDISAPTDDRPFFFNGLRPFPLKLSFILHPSKSNAAIQVLQNAVVIVIGLTLVLFFVPFLDNAKLRLLPYRELLSSSIYFAMIGLGFMAMEVYMIQKFILYMGNPAYSASVVLACLLLGLAMGAYMSVGTDMRALSKLIWAMPVLLVAVQLAMRYLFDATLHYHFLTKVIVAAALLMPCAFIGGFFFPKGVERFGDAGKPWFWAINGSFGVLASVVSLPVAMMWGYSKIIWVAVFAYLLAVLILLFSRRKAA